jgi:hypothetical protein
VTGAALRLWELGGVHGHNCKQMAATNRGCLFVFCAEFPNPRRVLTICNKSGGDWAQFSPKAEFHAAIEAGVRCGVCLLPGLAALAVSTLHQVFGDRVGRCHARR